MGSEQIPGIGAGTSTAWYIIPGRGLVIRWFNVLHWPFLIWHLSYVALGSALASSVDLALLGWTALAFFLGMGVAAHCFDLLRGDPLRLGLSRTALIMVAGTALGLAAGIGFWQWAQGNIPSWLVLSVPVGMLLAAGYNLEWPGLHGDWQFAAWWAVFPLPVGYFAQDTAFHPVLFPLALFAFCTAYAQRVISTRARYLRRRVGYVRVQLVSEGGQVLQAEKDWLLEPLDRALMWLSAAMVTLAGAMLLWRWPA